MKYAPAVKIAAAAAKNLKPASVQVKSKIKHTAQKPQKPQSTKNPKKHLGHAVANLAGNLLNPVKVAKSVKKAVTGKGLVLPGSNYIGPRNEMKGHPKSRGDAIAQQHDQDYDMMLRRGAKTADVYLGYNQADRRALKGSWKAAKKGSGQALAVAAGMGAKALLHKTGLTKRFSKGARKFEK